MCQSENSRRKTDAVRLQAVGRWDEIFARLVPQIAPALERPGRHVDCPFHGGKDDFRVARNFQENGRCFCTCGSWDGFGMVMHANGWNFVKAIKAIQEVLDGRPTQPEKQGRQEKKQGALRDSSARDAFLRNAMRTFWTQSLPLHHPQAGIARQYLASRGLDEVAFPVSDIRLHPGLEYRDSNGKVTDRYPALIAVVRSVDGKGITVHRTWLAKNGTGKAPVEEPRKQYPSMRQQTVTGAAIRLDRDITPILHVAEGLETALSVRALIGHTGAVWSTLNKGLMERLDVHESVKSVVIWADRDATGGGERSARTLMERIKKQGRQGKIMLPSASMSSGKTSIDWNDVVISLGLKETQRNLGVLKRSLPEMDALYG